MVDTVRAVILAFRFLTVVPWGGNGDVTPSTMGRSTAFFPLVGALLGAVLGVLAWGMRWGFPPAVVAALVLAAWVVLTGALHLDGFLDACDGLFGGHTPDARLHIMRDERVGAFALAGGVLLLLTKYTALAALLPPTLDPVPAFRAYLVLILPPTLGRFAMTLAVVAFPYARAEGLGRWMKDHAAGNEVLVAVTFSLLVAALILGIAGMLLVAVAAAVTWLGARFVMARIPGLTGDVYGALCELVEVTVLLFLIGNRP